jgi:hypothetical protein
MRVAANAASSPETNCVARKTPSLGNLVTRTSGPGNLSASYAHILAGPPPLRCLPLSVNGLSSFRRWAGRARVSALTGPGPYGSSQAAGREGDVHSLSLLAWLSAFAGPLAGETVASKTRMMMLRDHSSAVSGVAEFIAAEAG